MEKVLTVRLKNPNEAHHSCDKSPPISPSILLSPPTPIKTSSDSSCLNSPLVSPPSSAFVSALQSPYISPRAHIPTENLQQSPLSLSGSHHSDDVPSSSYTPPPENTTDFSGELTDEKFKFSTCVSDPMPPRISFSFPVVPHLSRCSLSPAAPPPPQSAKFWSCDVYLGYHGQNANLVRFCNWLKAELELHGIACFIANRAKHSDSQGVEMADKIICSATFGVVIITGSTFLNPFSLEELRIFNQKKNLIPLLFETYVEEVTNFLNQGFEEKQNLQEREWEEMVQGLLLRIHEFKLEAYDGAWRGCITKTVGILKSKLGRKSVAEMEDAHTDEFPYLRNGSFVGRQKELQEMELSFFGSTECDERKMSFRDSSDGTVDGFSVLEEGDMIRSRLRRSIDLAESRKCKKLNLDAWIDPVIELSKERSPQKQRQKPRKSRHGSKNSSRFEPGFAARFGSGNVVCLTGDTGSGKTEIALEFAYRYSQRYRLVLWVGGEAKYFRQNILNLSAKLGVDVSAETHSERGRVTNFEEQEMDAFQRVRRELFRDVPYLLIIDNLETETHCWEGIDVHDIVPRSSGATHIIITTKSPKVSSFKHLHVPALPFADVIVLMKGKRKKEYPSEEVDILRKFYDRLGQSSFGLGVVACLLFELAMSPCSLFQAIDKLPLPEAMASSSSMTGDYQFFMNNQFLIRTLCFCFTILREFSSRNLSSRMVLVGAWLAPSPVSATILSACAKGIPEDKNVFSTWKKCMKMAVCSGYNCFMVPRKQKCESESALLIAKLGLARRCSKQFPGCFIRFHEITQMFARRQGGLVAAKAMVQGVSKTGKPVLNFDHLWSAAFLLLGFESEPMVVNLSPVGLVLFVRRVAIPLALCSFSMFSRCNASLELLKLCTNMLEEVERSFVSRIQDWCHESLCWRKRNKSEHTVDEYVWQDVTLLKATLLETRAKLCLRGGMFDIGEDLCRTCISIRTVMLGHQHAQTLAAQETLAKLVRFRSKV